MSSYRITEFEDQVLKLQKELSRRQESSRLLVQEYKELLVELKLKEPTKMDICVLTGEGVKFSFEFIDKISYRLSELKLLKVRASKLLNLLSIYVFSRKNELNF